MKISAKTDIGTVRSTNQDSFAFGEFAENIAWAVVCDGMGGALAGNVASETAVKIISDKIKSGFHQGMNDNSIKHLMISAIDSANATVFSMSCKNEEYFGMGTTVVLAFINDDSLYIAHVGDSRIYLISESSINQLTKDHSFVQMMIDRGEISPEEAKDHPKKNVITRAIGIDSEVRIDFSQEELNEKETVLLCSDGLTNYIEIDTIKDICNSEDKFRLSDSLVDIANQNGGGDNITVVTLSQ